MRKCWRSQRTIVFILSHRWCDFQIYFSSRNRLNATTPGNDDENKALSQFNNEHNYTCMKMRTRGVDDDNNEDSVKDKDNGMVPSNQ